MRLVIYHNNVVKPKSDFAHTDMFDEVENLHIGKKWMQFQYKGNSTGTKNHAFFKLDNIAGYSIVG